MRGCGCSACVEALECTAGIGHGKRLRIATLCHAFLQFAFEIFGGLAKLCCGCELECRRKDCFCTSARGGEFLENAMAVAEGAICCGSRVQIACGIDAFDFNASLRNILTVSACVHVNRTAETPGNAGELVDTGKAFVNRVAGEAGERRGAFSANLSISDVRDFREKFTELDNDAFVSAVGDEQVRALAKNENRKRMFICKCNCVFDIVYGFCFDEISCGTADFKGRVLAHRYIFLNNHDENIYILGAMTEEELKQFKAALSITAVATALGVPVVRGRCRCFFPTRHSHGDRTPSVSFSEERGTFRCWVCDDVRGDVITLVQIVKNCSFLEALNWLKETYGFLLRGAPASATALPNGSSASNVSTAQSATLVAKTVTRDAALEYSSPEPVKELVSEEERKKIILSFLKMLSPVDKTPAASYLARRRIYKPIWDKMLLRTITDYGALNNKLKETYDLEVLKYVGLFSEKGNLRYYKHPLFFPYLDSKRRSFYFQARAIDSTVVPKELNLRGTVPYPYNVSALDEKPGWVYLCEGVVDTLTFLGQRIAAIGIPGVRSFKTEWLPLFKNKSVVLCLDKDEAGRSGTEYLQTVFAQAGIRTVVLGDGVDQFGKLSMKEGEDINDWFGGKK